MSNHFQLCLISLRYGFHVVRWGLVWDRTLFRQKNWLCVIINDDFLEMGVCYEYLHPHVIVFFFLLLLFFFVVVVVVVVLFVCFCFVFVFLFFC